LRRFWRALLGAGREAQACSSAATISNENVLSSPFKTCFPVPDRGEHAHRVGDARAEILVGRLDHGGLEAAQDGLVAFSSRSVLGSRRPSVLAQLPVACLARLERRVAGLDCLGEADVGERVLVPAVDLRVVGQRSELFQRRVHLLRRAFEQPPAAAGEQRVATEQRACPIIGNVRAGMSGMSSTEEGDAELRNAHRVALGYGPGERRDRLVFRPVDRNAEFLQQLGDSADVVGVVMRARMAASSSFSRAR